MDISLLKVHGAQDLEFIIDYNSIAHLNDALGPGWSHNFETWLVPLPNGSVQVNWNAKKYNLFTPLAANTNNYTCPDVPVIYDTLIRNANGSYSLKEPGQRHFEFDSQGRLQQVVNPHGQAIKLVYPSTTAYPTQIVEAVSGKAFNLAYNSSNLLAQVSDGLGRKVAFSYGTSNQLTQFVKTLGTVSQTNSFAYDVIGHILTKTNELGICVFTDGYDSQGRIISQQDAVSGNSTFSYDESQPNRIITTMLDRTGASTVYVHDQNYLLLSITDPLGHATSFGYDTNGNKTSITNALGQVQRLAYDSFGNVISATDAAGQTTTSRYDSRNNLTNVVNAAANAATFTFDTNNNLTASVDFLTNQVSLVYDTNALLMQSTAARGGKTLFLNSGGLPVRITNAVAGITGLAYDVAGRVAAVTNAAGFVSTNAYDLNNNLIATADGLGNLWRYTYDSAGRIITAIDPLNATTWFTYNGNGDLIAQTNALGQTTTFTYDREDRLLTTTDANGHTRRMAYDSAGRLTSVADAINHTNLFQYDAGGNLTATVDALGITSQVTLYDVRNLPYASIDALGHTKQMAYDSLQRLVQIVDALNRTNTLNYDAMSQPIGTVDPLLLMSQQKFDGDGNRTAVINPKSAQFGFQYDLADRMTNALTPLGKKTSYTLDGRNLATNILQASGAQTILKYDGAGHLTNSQDTAGTRVFNFDGKGRLLTITENSKSITNKFDVLDRLTNYTDSAGNVLKYAYDSVGNLTNLTYPDGKNVSYAYDAANRLATVTDWGGRRTSYAYDSNNRVTGITNANGTVTTRIYDIAGRLIQQKDTTAAAGLIHQVNFNYDSADQIIGETNQPAVVAFQPVTLSMKYDADNALTNYAAQTVTNDANGNLTFGPLTNGTFAKIAYDVRNRLMAAGGFTNAYDPAGNRVAITNGASVMRFVVNPNAALSQVLMRVKGGVTNYYVYGLGLLYEVTPASGTNRVLTYHFDYRGSTVAITDTNGAVTDQISYSPYGGITSRTGTNDTPFLFNGSYGVQTDANGLLYMRARFYNTAICRFVNSDPIGMAGGVNWYAFANGNPINDLDPSGNYVGIDDIGAMIAGATIAYNVQKGVDALTGKKSSFGSYLGTTIAGAFAGEATLYPEVSGPVLLLAGAAGNLYKQASDEAAGQQATPDAGNFLFDTSTSFLSTRIKFPELKIPGITAGSGSWLAAGNGKITALDNGNISNIKPATWIKWLSAKGVLELPDSVKDVWIQSSLDKQSSKCQGK